MSWKFAGALARIARGENVSADTGKLAPMTESPRHELIRKFVEAFNTRDIARIRGFRAEYMEPRRGDSSEEERDRFAKRMIDGFQSLTPEGIPSEDDQGVTVQMKTGRGELARIRFFFAPNGKISGLQVEMGI